MHESKRLIEVALSPIMKVNGYRKRQLTWRKRQVDAILVFHGEKNRWGLKITPSTPALRQLAQDYEKLYPRVTIGLDVLTFLHQV